jgi:hypothetical protein
MGLGLPRAVRFLVLLAALAGGGAHAAQRALLVGVSELVNQPSSLWLQAPRNDVLLMREALQKQGFAASDIAVLADGVPGAALPEAQRIHEALGQLLAQSNSGDFVLLYFSGHGTRLRDAAKRYQEPDGLAENFLARDVRGLTAAGSAGAAGLAGGLRDVDVDAWVGAFLARNVFVWTVFDTCSAASMTRGGAGPETAQGPADDEVRFRGLRPGQLAPGATPGAPVPAGPGAPAAQDVPRARYVAFFASESHQVTPELRLPRKDRGARPQGLLTWALAESLQRRPATWRELFDGVLALYPPVIDELAERFPQRELPSPVAEGNLDAPVFANSAQPLSTRPVWRARRTGGSLALDAGALDGLEAGQPVRVLATLADGTVRNAETQLSEVEDGSARLAAPPALAALSGPAQAVQWAMTPLDVPDSVALRVRADQPLPEGLALRYPSGIRRVAGEGEADLRWTDLGAAGHRVEILSPELGTLFDAAGHPAAMRLPDIAALRQRLAALAQIKWLARLGTLAAGGRIEGFDAALETWSGGRMLRSEPVRTGVRLPPPGAREQVALTVRNASGHSLDLVIVGIDAQGAVRPVFPQEPGESNRFERGTREAPAAKRFALPWLGGAGGARVLVLASPAAPQSAPRLFGAGAGDALADLRVRGALLPDKPRAVFAAMPRWQ